MKKNSEKGPRAVPQNMRLRARYNDSKPRIWNSFFGNIISGKTIFYICPHVPVDVIIDFFNEGFLAESFKANKK